MSRTSQKTLYFLFLSVFALLLTARDLFSMVSVQYVTQWGSPGAGPGQFENPWGIAVDSMGYVYVAEQVNHRVQKFDSTGTYITSWGGLYYPGQLAIDSINNVYVADAGHSWIQEYDSTGGFINRWGSGGAGDGKFNNPYGVAVDSASNVYVADSYNHRVQKFTSSGIYITQWGSEGSSAGEFESPYGLAVDSMSNVYVADTVNNRIQKFTSSGTYITQWGGVGPLDGQFSSPWGITADNSGRVYVADRGNHRIQVFTPAGEYIGQFGTYGAGPGQFNEPLGVAVGTSSVYVTELNMRVQKFRVFSGTIKGKITGPDGVTGLAGARVRVFRDGPELSGAESDSSGNYSMIVGTGTFGVFFSSAGYISAFSSGVVVEDRGTAVVDVSLSPAPAGLSAWWKFDENGGALAFDYSGNDYNGTKYGTAVAGGKLGNGLEFGGTGLDYVNCGNYPALHPGAIGSTTTVTLWFKAANTDTNIKTILSDKNNSGGAMGVGMDVVGPDLKSIRSYGAGDYDYRAVFSGILPDTWYHLSAVINSDKTLFYVNGQYIGAQAYHLAQQAVSPLYIGKTAEPADVGGWGGYFNGVIDEVKIYGRALSQQEILSDAEADSTVYGKVTRLDGVTPVAGAQVEALQGLTVISGTASDSYGNYMLRLDTGTYDVRAVLAGFVTSTFTAVEVSSYSAAQENFILAKNPAPAPAGFKQDAVYITSAAVSWDNVGAERYGIERSSDTAGVPGTWSFVVTWSSGVTGTNFTDTGLAPETTYWYRERTYNAEGVINGTPGSGIIILTLPTSPSVFSGIVLSTSSIKWVWPDISDGDSGYRVYSSTDGAIATLAADTTQWIENNLLPNTSYTRSISAFNASGETGSNTSTLYTLAKTPLNLTGDASAAGLTVVSLSWDNAGATRYAVERAADNSGAAGAYSPIITWGDALTDTHFQDSSITGDATYWYRIKSYNGDGALNPVPGNEAEVYVHSTVLDHYEVTAATYAFAGRHFSVRIKAKNHTDDTIVNYSGSVNISAVRADNETLAGGGILGIVQAELTDGKTMKLPQVYTKAESIKLKAVDSGDVTGLSGVIDVACGTLAQLSLRASTGLVVAAQTDVLTATVKDAYGNPVPAAPVYFSVIKGSGTVNISSGTSGSGGQLTATFTAAPAQAESDAVRASAGELSAETIINAAVTVSAGAEGTISAGADPGTEVTVPAGAAASAVNIVIRMKGDLDSTENGLVASANTKAAGNTVAAFARAFRAVKNDGSDYGNFEGLVTIDLPYADTDGDGIVDGTGLKADELKAFRLNETAQAWEVVADGGINQVDRPNKRVRAQVRHFSIYTIGIAAETTLESIVVYPNPVNFASAVEGKIKFDRLSAGPTIKIYDITGMLVRTLRPGTADNDGAGGRAYWDGKNEEGHGVAMGTYLFAVTDAAGHKKTGKLCVIK